MLWLRIAVRLLFLCLFFCALALGLFVFAFMGAFSSDDPGCTMGQCRTQVSLMTLAFCLPAAVMILVAWWRSEASIKGMSANQGNDLGWYRLSMLIVLALSALTALWGNIFVRSMALPLLAAGVVTWIIVEITHVVAGRRRVISKYPLST